MPGLPVTIASAIARGMLLATMLAAPAALAQEPTSQPSVETLMYHMTSDKDVAKARRLYRSSVDTAMLYSQCPTEYKVDDAKRQHMDRVLYEDELKLRQALTAAHQLLTFKLPGQGVLAAVDKYIADFRNNEAIELGTLINSRKGGCNQATLERLDKAYEERRAMEAHLAAQAAAEAEKRRQQVPAVNEQPEQPNE